MYIIDGGWYVYYSDSSAFWFSENWVSEWLLFNAKLKIEWVSEWLLFIIYYMIYITRIPSKMMGRWHVTIRKAWLWIIMGNVFGKCHAPYTLNTFLVDSKKSKLIKTSTTYFRPCPTLNAFSLAVKSHWPCWPTPSLISIYIYIYFFIHYWTAHHHWCCEFESLSGRGVQHYVIKFVSDLRQVGGFLRFPLSIKLI
jgi:hypothetical protein